jgi:hypothetical protein
MRQNQVPQFSTTLHVSTITKKKSTAAAATTTTDNNTPHEINLLNIRNLSTLYEIDRTL